MKKIKILIVMIIVLVGSGLRAQVTLNCESGNRAIEQGNCWIFGAVAYTSTVSSVIAGSWSCRSNQLTSALPTACWIISPWMLVGNGNITFKAKFEGTAGTTRGIELYYIPYDQNAPNNEGTAVQFYTYNWPKPWPTATAQNFIVPLAAAITNSTQVYKIRVSFVGTGGTARIISDDYSIPGTYMSDPAHGCIPLALIQDADNDGVADSDDAYPNDPTRAYNSYFPAQNQDGTLSFEDLWPAKGDYDFNDVVVNYRLQKVTNSANNVVELKGKFVLRASGAGYHDGFGFQIDGISPAKVTSITGNSISAASIYSFAPNGLENGQTYATCIVFDDFYHVMPSPGTGIGINTDKTAPFVPYETLNVNMTFINNGTPPPGGTVSNAQLNLSQVNFFIVANKERGHEIHMPDYQPTSLVNSALFGSLDDDSNPALGKYYKTANNLPWGVNVLQGSDYPSEKVPINEAFLHFIDWAGSSGSNFPNWFQSQPGYQNNEKVY
ncbi:MAG: LruC domain-containing protein [Bacteroidales bacterium]